MTAFRLYPPTEPQLHLIHKLCEERGLEPPETIASLQEGSAIIAAIFDRTYQITYETDAVVKQLADSLTDAERAYVLGKVGA